MFQKQVRWEWRKGNGGGCLLINSGVDALTLAAVGVAVIGRPTRMMISFLLLAIIHNIICWHRQRLPIRGGCRSLRPLGPNGLWFTFFVLSHGHSCSVRGLGHDYFPSFRSLFDRAIETMGGVRERIGRDLVGSNFFFFFNVFRWLCLGEVIVRLHHGFTADNYTIMLYS